MDDAIIQDFRFQPAAMLQGAKDPRNLGNLFQVAARFEKPQPTHDHAPDGEFAVKQVNERDAPGNDITPRLVGKHLRAKLSSSKFESFFFDEGYGFVWPFGFNPRIAKETVSLQAAVRESFYLSHVDHSARRFGRNVKSGNPSLPC